MAWMEAEAFLEKVSVEGPSTEGCAIWCYRAPARILDCAPAGDGASAIEVLDRWLSQNRRALNSRRYAGDRLAFVNADRIDRAGLRADLGMDASIDGDVAVEGGTGQPESEATSRVVAYLLAWAAPDYCETYESLEAAARWRSGPPDFRGQQPPDIAELGEILGALQAGPGPIACAPSGDTGLRGKPEQLVAAASELEGMRRIVAESDAESDLQLRLIEELREDNAYLHLELARMREDLSRSHAPGGEEAETIASDLGTRSQAGAADAAGAGEEAGLLLEHLQLAQEELEQQHLRNIELLEELKSEKRDRQALASQLRQAEAMLPRPRQARSGRRSGWSWIPMPRRIKARFARAEQKKITRQRAELIGKSEWFDRTWYLTTYSDVRSAGVDAAEHYYEFGWKEGRNPSAIFDTAYYLKNYPDVARSGFNPLWHYVTYGLKEGRRTRKP